MISPNLNIAPDSDSQECRCQGNVEIGYDVAAKYYTLSKREVIILKGDMHLEATKKLVFTIKQVEKLRDDINLFFGAHEKFNGQIAEGNHKRPL